MITCLSGCFTGPFWEDPERWTIEFFSFVPIRRFERPAKNVTLIHFAQDDGSTTVVGYVDEPDGRRYARLWIEDWEGDDYRPDHVVEFLKSRPASMWRNPTPRELAERAGRR